MACDLAPLPASDDTAIRGRQLRLFPPSNPLVDRLGRCFFQAVPDAPGIYLMQDQEGRVIYVGKAKNLRQRLNSYRHLACASRKTIRLVHQVARIEWHVCPSERAAILRENELLRTLRPRFNRAGVWPQGYQFIRLWRLTDGFALEWFRGFEPQRATHTAGGNWFETAPSDAGSDAFTYGAFKGARRILPALARRLDAALRPSGHPIDNALFASGETRMFSFARPEAGSWFEDLKIYLAGASPRLVERLGGVGQEPGPGFQAALKAADLESLEHFFQHGPARNEHLCRSTGRASLLITCEELDDLQVRCR